MNLVSSNPQLDARRRRTKYGLMHHEKLCVRETPIRGLKVTQDLHKTETISSFGDKEQINKKCPGGALIAGASRVWEICQKKIRSGWREVMYDVDLRLIFCDVSPLRAACGRPQCVLPPFAGTCSSTSSTSISLSPPSPLSKPPLSSRLRVVFIVSFVMSI